MPRSSGVAAGVQVEDGRLVAHQMAVQVEPVLDAVVCRRGEARLNGREEERKPRALRRHGRGQSHACRHRVQPVVCLMHPMLLCGRPGLRRWG